MAKLMQMQAPKSRIRRTQKGWQKANLNTAVMEFLQDVVASPKDITAEEVIQEATIRNVTEDKRVQRLVEMVEKRQTAARSQTAGQVAGRAMRGPTSFTEQQPSAAASKPWNAAQQAADASNQPPPAGISTATGAQQMPAGRAAPPPPAATTQPQPPPEPVSTEVTTPADWQSGHIPRTRPRMQIFNAEPGRAPANREEFMARAGSDTDAQAAPGGPLTEEDLKTTPQYSAVPSQKDQALAAYRNRSASARERGLDIQTANQKLAEKRLELTSLIADMSDETKRKGAQIQALGKLGDWNNDIGKIMTEMQKAGEGTTDPYDGTFIPPDFEYVNSLRAHLNELTKTRDDLQTQYIDLMTPSREKVQGRPKSTTATTEPAGAGAPAAGAPKATPAGRKAGAAAPKTTTTESDTATQRSEQRKNERVTELRRIANDPNQSEEEREKAKNALARIGEAI